jgi:hypothetical protein
MVLIDEADRHEVDAGRAPVELIHDLEVDPKLLDLGRAVQLVVIVEAGAGVLELDLSVEDDVVRNQIGRQQNETPGVEAVLPLAARSWVLHGAEKDLAIGADAETGNRGVGQP